MTQKTYTITVKDTVTLEDGTTEEKEYSCIVREPGRKELGAFIKLMKDDDMLAAGDVLLYTCWVSGDREIKDREDLRIPASLQACQAIEIKEASIKKN